MQNVAIYINHRASNAQFDKWKSDIEKTLFRSNLHFRSPNGLDELQSCLRQDVESKLDAIVSVGGDGTANTILQTLASSNVGFLVLPAGTANDLASELGNRGPSSQIVKSLRYGKLKKIDLISINGKFMATNGGLGLAQYVAQTINKVRKDFPLFKKLMKFTGKNIYGAFFLKELFAQELKYFDLQLTTEAGSERIKTPLLLVNNQPILAGRFKVAPNTKNNDGKFNILALTHKTRAQVIATVVKVLLGQYPTHDPDFRVWETSHATIENKGSGRIDFFGDGEVFPASSRFDISLVPAALNVFTANELTGENIDFGQFFKDKIN